MSSAVVASPGPNDAPAASESPQPRPAQAPPPLFSPDTDGTDTVGRGTTARFLADLVSHRAAGTPFLVALLGSAGSGKSALLRRILDALPSAGASAARDGASPVVGVRVDASAGAEPAATLVSRVFAALSSAYSGLAEDAVHAGSDPLAAARSAGERVNELRRQLDAERQVLDEIGGRQARLAETVLFESPGSRVDAYARANRGRIDARLRSFGIPTTDPIASYKHQVREVAESGTGAGQAGLVFKALWGFKGQAALVVLAVLLLVIGWICATLAGNPDGLAGWLDGFGDRFAGLTAWARDRAGWLGTVSHAAFGLAFVAILVDIVRAIRFLQPVLKGAALLKGDLDGRRHDLDSLLAHQTRRVDHLVSELDAAVRTSENAERRLEARRAAGLVETNATGTEGLLSAPASTGDSAEAFFAGLSAAIDGAGQQSETAPAVNVAGGAAARSNAAGPGPVPRRIVVGIDELDRLTPGAAAAFLETASRLLARPNFVILVAVERSHILAGFAETDPALAAARLDRYVQLSYDLDADAAIPGGARLGGESRGASGSGQDPRSGIDLPWQPFETPLVQALSAFAGPNPRSTKRFVNSYRVARSDPRLNGATPAELAALACALALDRNGAAAEFGSYRDTPASTEAGAPPNAHIARALAVAQQAIGSSFTPADARRGLQVARIYSRRG